MLVETLFLFREMLDIIGGKALCGFGWLEMSKAALTIQAILNQPAIDLRPSCRKIVEKILIHCVTRIKSRCDKQFFTLVQIA